MLVNCPRCGFSQPNDQYCAQCGVDMVSYKPKSQPILKRIIQSGTFQIIFLLVTAVLIGQFIIRNETSSSWVKKITRSQGVTKSIRTKSTAAPNAMVAEAESAQASEQVSASASTAADLTPESSELSGLKNKEISVAVQSQNIGNRIKQRDLVEAENSTFIKIEHASLKKEILQQWITESTNTGHYLHLQNYSVGVIFDYANHENKYIPKPGHSTSNIRFKASEAGIIGQLWEGENENTPQFVGLVSEFDLQSYSNRIFQGILKIAKKNGPNSSENFQISLDFPEDAIVFITGVLKKSDFEKKEWKTPLLLSSLPFDKLEEGSEIVTIIHQGTD